MNFIEGLKKCGGSMERVRSPTVDAKNFDMLERVKIYRPAWRTMNPPYPLQFVWVTSGNVPVASLGNNQSMPLIMECADFMADDWEIYYEKDRTTGGEKG